ncbi:NPHP3 [Symbiodinium natans]|uniref:NPHP3 protein n=1 Tax=Symbiodinium natans TaxID=878477 RepID=A0A812UMA1_9DINO|nr:NPHP3 [Symbiodinium natans]
MKITPKSAIAWNLRGIAKKAAGHSDFEDDYAMADVLAESEKQLEEFGRQRKLSPTGWQSRDEVEAKKSAKGTDFLVSFALQNKLEDNQILFSLGVPGVWLQSRGEQALRPVTFCTDRSLSLAHSEPEVLAGEREAWQLQRDSDGLPGWFADPARGYRKCARETNFGILILRLNAAYICSMACRWELGYIAEELLHFFIPSSDTRREPNRIIAWKDILQTPELCRRAFADPEFDIEQGESAWNQDEFEDAQAEIMARDAVTRISDMAELMEEELKERRVQFQSELRLRQLAHLLASSYLDEVDGARQQATEQLASLHRRLGNEEEYSRLMQRMEADKNDHAAEGPHATVRKLERSLNMGELKFGESHGSVERALDNLATALHKIENFSREREMLRRLLNIREQNLGEDHADVEAVKDRIRDARPASITGEVYQTPTAAF